MASILSSRNLFWVQCRSASRSLTTAAHTSTPSSSSVPPPAPPTDEPAPMTHFKITLRRSAISLGDKIKGTLISLGIHRRMQTVYHRHSPEVAGKILRVKELVEVENVPESLVLTKQQQTLERRATRGYKVLGNRRDAFMGVGRWES
ncbi:putative 54S ribosomal protein L33, mitochondrial [Hypsizygus marmoreus]|uniref:Large ribosomal subunit protein uL30m n=1 Tax=Hypsizygus marmoreus TaxID=39966 RepID=A0A369K3Q9_HYPMA|nr:putative 54S ribosomal protein L33, mitochondrial [Hypsizygus marmoreus]